MCIRGMTNVSVEEAGGAREVPHRDNTGERGVGGSQLGTSKLLPQQHPTVHPTGLLGDADCVSRVCVCVCVCVGGGVQIL